MEENNRKGPGVFYAVVGVATLVVAIIGATFAFFSASANDNSTIQGTTASAGGLYMSVRPLTGGVTDSKTLNMIPLNVNEAGETGVNSVAQFQDAISNGCIDKNGNRVCQIYAITIANKSATSKIQVQGKLTLNSEAQNMTWKLIELSNVGTFSYVPAEGVTAESINDDIAFETGTTTATEVDGYAVDHVTGTANSAEGFLTVKGNTNIADSKKVNNTDAESRNLGFTSADNSHTYYVLVWLEETGTAQEQEANGNDAGKNYTGVVTFDAVDAEGNKSGLTASF